MSPTRLIAVAISLLAPIAAMSASTACDPVPDSCVEGSAYCDGNTVNNCVSDGAEAHATEHKHDCGADALCFVASDTRGALCARKGADGQAATCPTANEQACKTTKIVATCVPDRVGSNYWVDDQACPDAMTYYGVFYPDRTCQPVPVSYNDSGVTLACQ